MTKCNISGFQHIITEMKLVIESDGVNGETKKKGKNNNYLQNNLFCVLYLRASTIRLNRVSESIRIIK